MCTRQKTATWKFIALIDKYENFDTLTNTMLNEFVEKILVHERSRKGSQDTTQEIEIYFNFLGRYIPPSLQPVPLTPEEQEELRKREERKDRLHQNYLKRKASGAQKRYEDKIKAKKKAEMDEGSGFCFGVVTAINKAEEELSKSGTLYCLGDIVHNSREVERLKAMGLITINHGEFNRLHNAKVLLRAHGEPPETYITARRNNIEIIDATCPVVLRLQKKIKQEYIQEDNEDKQIVIYGKNGHAEVLGLVGQTTGKAIVIEKLEEAKSLDFSKSIRLYSQTTKSLDEFQKIVEYIKEHISSDVTFEYYDTICRQVANRIPNIRKFAASHDLVFFVSGKKSSNGKILFNECKKVNPNSHLIDSAEEIDNRLLIGTESIGICGATSTPKWLMEEISKAIKSRI